MLFLPLNGVYTSFMDICSQLPLRQLTMQIQKSWPLHWHSLSEWGNQCVTFSVSNKYCHYIHYIELLSDHFLIPRLKLLKIVKTLLTLIFKMGWQRKYEMFLRKRPQIHRIWINIKKQHQDNPRWKARYGSHSVDTSFENRVVTRLLALLPMKAVIISVMLYSEQITLH
jgi:hypothetical protein